MHAVVPAHLAARIAGHLAAVRAGCEWAARQADVPA